MSSLESVSPVATPSRSDAADAPIGLSWTAEVVAASAATGLERGEISGPITEAAPLTVPGELRNPELTGPLDSEWLNLPTDEVARRLAPPHVARRPDDGTVDELDTQRLHPTAPVQSPPVSTSVMPLSGQIGRYTLERRLGSGGLGTVWSAYDTVLARQVAIKTLPLHMPAAEREAIAERVLDEARAAARLSHPHIVTVHDAGIAGEGAYLAMELLRGKDLAELLRNGWQPTPEQAALIVRRVADALGYAHSKGVIHRDIKPANIFMVGRTRPVVLDFGIARLLHQDGDASPALGSPYYAAPEQFDGRDCDQRSDVYSLGVVLYELLCGERPFQGAQLQDIRTAVRNGHPPPPRQHRPSVPAELEVIALKAIARDPSQRHRSAGALARELRAWLAGPADIAAAPVPVPTLSPPPRPAATKAPSATARSPLSHAAAAAGAATAVALPALARRAEEPSTLPVYPPPGAVALPRPVPQRDGGVQLRGIVVVAALLAMLLAVWMLWKR
jgi:serine/threonine-protein kinase